jgi:hypothetical protein
MDDVLLYVKENFRNRIALNPFLRQRRLATEPYRPAGHKPVMSTA